MKRPIITTIDTVLEMLKDYTAGQIPRDGKAVTLRFNPKEMGKLGIAVVSDEWPDKTDAPVEVKFEIRRMFGA